MTKPRIDYRAFAASLSPIAAGATLFVTRDLTHHGRPFKAGDAIFIESVQEPPYLVWAKRRGRNIMIRAGDELLQALEKRENGDVLVNVNAKSVG